MKPVVTELGVKRLCDQRDNTPRKRPGWRTAGEVPRETMMEKIGRRPYRRRKIGGRFKKRAQSVRLQILRAGFSRAAAPWRTTSSCGIFCAAAQIAQERRYNRLLSERLLRVPLRRYHEQTPLVLARR
ncbi:hypothetical protein [Salipiger mangrovisoli]|uniref:Uncharacterized protein n=1 Tax=Salipiger mangrovisoli TaxID=2865933 RepID=A0ABR9X5D2_9RHOB|nr:hypothetical protein [Salipiger mangrovisoli]MBE9638779.1 hypothetical protein [Salipiger mangrovisoli]